MRPSWRCSVKIGNVRQDDDQHREERRPAHLEAASATSSLNDRVLGSLVRCAAEDVLDNDHRAVDDDAEIHRAEREQVGRNAFDRQADERRQQRQRDHDGDDGRRSHASQEEEQHQADQQRAFGKILEHRLQRAVDQPGAVVVGHQLHALGQDALD